MLYWDLPTWQELMNAHWRMRDTYEVLFDLAFLFIFAVCPILYWNWRDKKDAAIKNTHK